MRFLLLLAFAIAWASQAYAMPFSCYGKKGIEKKECECGAMKGPNAKEVCKAELESMKDKALAKTRNTVNQGQGAGAGVNVFAGLPGAMNSEEDQLAGMQSLVGVKNTHYVGIGMSVYFLPSEPGYKRQMPARFFPNQIEYHYYLNPNWSAGVMWQDYTLKGTPFSPITEKQMVDEEVVIVNPDTGEETTEVRSVEKDVVIRQPGSDEMKIQRLWGIMAFHIDIAKEVELEVLGGYSLIYDVLYTTEGYPDENFSPPKPFMMAIAAGYKPVDKDYVITGGFRFVDSPTEAPDMLDYRSPGGAEVFAGIRFGVL